jgi:DNA repair exonuclease SbcCD ATPase subunit
MVDLRQRQLDVAHDEIADLRRQLAAAQEKIENLDKHSAQIYADFTEEASEREKEVQRCHAELAAAQAAIALAESAPAEQPPSGAMTLEQARDWANNAWMLMHPWSDREQHVAQEFVTIDRKARREMLEWTRWLVNNTQDAPLMTVEIERRLKELKR